jgi:hypothetical protein
MGLVDKVKAQASVLAEKAQVQTQAGQDKLAQLNARRQANAVLLELGGLVWAEEAGRPVPGAAERKQVLFERLRQFEGSYGPIQVTSADSPSGAIGGLLGATGGAPSGGRTAADGHDDVGGAPDAPSSSGSAGHDPSS